MTDAALLRVCGAGVLFASFVILASLVLQESRQRNAVRKRVEAIVSPHAPARAPAAAVPKRSLAAAMPLVSERVLGWLGVRRSEAEIHRVRWPFAVIAALFFARAVAGALSVVIGDFMVPLATVPIWIGLCRWFFAWCRHRYLQSLYVQFPDALNMVVRAVRVGITVGEAIRTVGREAPMPTGRVFSRIVDRIAIGLPVDEAVRDVMLKVGLPEYQFFATALSLQTQTGGALSETLDNLADVIRRRVATRARGHALASEARASAMFLTALPFVAGGALAVLNPDYVGVLFFDPTGQKILLAATGLLTAGTVMMRGIIRKSLS